MPIHLSEDDAVDRLVNTDPFAFLVAMLLDQQVPIAWAFAGPRRLAERLGHLDPDRLSAMDPEALADAAATSPAIHRYHRSMAGRIQELASTIVSEHGGEAARIWNEGADAATVVARLTELPGFGEEKAKITLAALAKRFDVRPKGWEEASAPFSDDQPRSVADIGSPEDHERVKAWKKGQKNAGRTKADPTASSS